MLPGNCFLKLQGRKSSSNSRKLEHKQYTTSYWKGTACTIKNYCVGNHYVVITFGFSITTTLLTTNILADMVEFAAWQLFSEATARKEVIFK